MNHLWLKIKVWLKIVVFALVAFYAISFILENTGQDVRVWVWFGQQWNCSLLTALMGTFIAGVVFAILARMVLRTYRQLSQIRQRSRTDRMERENMEMRAKAAKLQTRPEVGDH